MYPPSHNSLPAVEVVAGVLEVLIDQRPDLLEVYLDTVANSPLRQALLEVARILGATRLDELGAVLAQTSHDLSTLERRSRWRHPRHVVERPNLGGLLLLSRARRLRPAFSPTRRRQLKAIERKVGKAYETEMERQWIVDFIGAKE